jgi:hypothetical protein
MSTETDAAGGLSDAVDGAKKALTGTFRDAFSSTRGFVLTSIFTAVTLGALYYTGGMMSMTPFGPFTPTLIPPPPV